MCEDLARNAREVWQPFLRTSKLDAITQRNFLLYLGIDGAPYTAEQLAALPWPEVRKRHVRLCERLVWAFADPAARKFVYREFYD